MSYNFDKLIDRTGTHSVKYGLRNKLFGTENVIPLWVADMDFETPDFIQNALRKRVGHPVYGYTYHPESFYESAQGWVKRRHNWNPQTEWMSFSPGIVPGVNLSILAFTEPEDRVMIQPPVYFPFFQGIEKNNRTLVENRLVLKNGRYEVDFEDFENQLKQGVALFILSNPHNPGGNVWRREELQKMGELCVLYGTRIIADEIHSDIVFPPYEYVPMASLSDEIAHHTITFIAPSKTFNVAGLSSSLAITVDQSMKKEFDRMMDRLHISNGNIFGSVAFEAAYNQGDEWLDQLMDYLEANREYLTQTIHAKIEGIKVIQPEGTYLAWLDCRGLPLEKEKIHEFMVQKAGLGLSDGASFGENGLGFQRLNFGCPRATLEKALENLDKAVHSLKI